MVDTGPQENPNSQEESTRERRSDREHEPDRKQEADRQEDVQRQNDPDKQKDLDEPPSEAQRNRLKQMEHPYRGPERYSGISAHGLEGETDLRRAKQYAEMIVDTVREGLLVLDFDLRVEAANESFYRMFEVTPGETEGSLIYELGNEQWDIPELRELLEEILPNRNVMTGYEVTHEFETIGRRIMRLNARQLDDHQRILLAIQDITERNEAEEMLRVSEEKLREMNRSLEKRVRKRTAELRQQTGRLRRLAAELTSAEQRERRRLASLLHDDLQQLLYGTEMKLNIARGKVETEEARAVIEDALTQLGEAVESARSLTRQLRPPALYESGLLPALEWLASDMAERHGLEVSVDIGEVKTSAIEQSLGDDVKALLYESARELLFNVVKYADVGEARLGLSLDSRSGDAERSGAETTDTDQLHLAVEDEGRGFDAEEVFHEDEADGEAAQGGFGLFSIRQRIVAFGGSVEIDARPGEGTRVELSLPLGAPTDAEPAPSPAPAEKERLREEGRPDDRRPKEHRREAQAESRPPKVRVAVADDHAVVRQGIANLLVAEERTTVVGEAASGREAVEVVERTRPDIVLMDVNMPEMNGVEATREIRDRWPETDVIGLSVQDDLATRESMLQAGAAAFSPKSGDVDQVIDTVLRVTGQRSKGDRLQTQE